jgi:hypothetical protein
MSLTVFPVLFFVVVFLLSNNKASSYWFVQGDAGYDKYTYVNQRQAFSRPVPSRLLSGAIRYLGTIQLPSGIRQTTIWRNFFWQRPWTDVILKSNNQ